MTSLKKHDSSFGDSPELSVDHKIALEGEEEEEVNVGVKTVEAAEKVYGKYSKWFLFIGLGLASYIYSLDGQTTYTYLAYATSTFSEHSLISSIQVAEGIIIAVGKPFIAKVADITSRGTAYLVVLIFYVIGYIVIASARSIGAIAAGIILYAIGYTGLQLLTQIIIADITTLKWRGLVSGLMSTPFIINAFIGANVSTQVLEHSTWRWGYGMFAILIPASLAPLIVTLFWAELKAKKLGLVKVKPTKPAESWLKLIWTWFEHFDVVGLTLLGTAVALILLPLTLSSTAKGGWHNPSMIAMIVIGCVLLFPFIIWDTWFAKRPIMPLQFLKNRAFIGAAWIGFFDFVSFYLTNTYLYSFVVVTKPWSLIDTTYFSSTQTVALTVFGICAGFVMRWTHEYKWILTIGLCIRIIGVGLMIHTRGSESSDAEIVWTQILQGLGGGIASCATQVGAQASVPHVDVGIITAVVLLWTEIGGSVGSSIAGAIWSNVMPGKLAKHLPDLPLANRTALYDSITTVTAYPRGDPIREGVISAYEDTMKILCIAATCISILPILFSLMMPNFYLGDQQNAVDNIDLQGERKLAPPESSETSMEERHA